MAKLSGIYQISNLITGDFYIGSSKNIAGRLRKHKDRLIKNVHGNKHFQSSFNKHRLDNFKFETIEYCNPNLLLVREQYYFDLLEPAYNKLKIAGSSIGWKMSQDQKNRLSEAYKGRVPSNKGVPHKESTKKLLREAWVRKKERGYTCPHHVKQALSRKVKGKKQTPEHIANVLKAKYGEDYKQKEKAIPQFKGMKGENNHQFGKRGPLNKNYGKKCKEETKLKIKAKAKQRWDDWKKNNTIPENVKKWFERKDN